MSCLPSAEVIDREPARIQALRALEILDSPREERFDRITKLATKLFDVPIALVSLVDEYRQWFKSSAGIDIAETTRSVSFCSHSLASGSVLIVPDARKDPRFRDNRLVTGAPHVRFYAGRPLRVPGDFLVGTLCIISPEPRVLTGRELELLDQLGEMAEAEINASSVQRAREQVRKLEAEREEQRRMFQAFMNHTPCLVYIKDPDSRIRFVNQQFQRSFGVTTEEMLGRRDSDWLPSEAAEQNIRNDRAVLTTGKKLETIESVADVDGKVREWLSIKFPIARSNGEALVGGVSIEMTAQRAAERELKRVTSIQRGILDAASCSIISVDLTGTIVTFNKTAEDWLGYTADEVVGKCTPQIFHLPSELEQRAIDLTVELCRPVAVEEVFIVHALEDQTREQVWTHVRKDGSRYFTALTVSPLKDENGKVTGFLGVGRDITQEKIMQAALCQAKEAAEQARAAAEQANQMKSRFLANMSHEIRTPLNGILGITTMLMDSALDGEQQHLARTIHSSGEALLHILNDILDFSKVEAGMVQLEEVDYDLAGLLREVQQLYAIPASGKGLTIETDLATTAPRHLRGDPVRMRQVIGNLVSNAIKFSEKGRIVVKAEAIAEASDKPAHIRLAVCDSGMGIPSKLQERIFDPFQQADSSTSRRFGGTGLGLAICRHLVELMGGTIAVTSRWGHGSTFHFEIPLRLGMPPGATSDVVCDAVDIPLGLKVLVAEDSSVNQIVIKHELQKIGCHVEIAVDGRHAINAHAREMWDLILMDCQMPEVDGFEATAAIRKTESHRTTRTPIVAITANALEGERERCLDSGMDDYLTKPFTRDKLRKTIGNVCARFSICRETALNPAVIAAIIEEAGESRSAFLGDLCRAFEDEIAAAINVFESIGTNGTDERLSKVAHKLAGTSSIIGALSLAALCRNLEVIAADPGTNGEAVIIKAIRREIDAVMAELAALK